MSENDPKSTDPACESNNEDPKGVSLTAARTERFTASNLFSQLPTTTPTRIVILIRAIRNPNTSFNELSTALDIPSRTVRDTLQSFATGTLGKANTGNDWTQVRSEENRSAQTIAELTEKQRAVIEVLARFPNVLEVKTGTEFVEAARALTGVSITDSYAHIVGEQYEELVEEYRATLDDDEVQPITDSTDDLPHSDPPISSMSLHELLNHTGIELPHTDLDRDKETDTLEFKDSIFPTET